MWKRLHPVQWGALLLLTILAVAGIVGFAVGLNDGNSEHDEIVAVEDESETPPVRPDDSSCEQSMRAAADVPLSETNDKEFLVTLTACETPSEWEAALRAHPDALGLTDLTNDDVSVAMQAACWNADEAGITSTLCAIARQDSLIE